jgi:hypothetical protein
MTSISIALAAALIAPGSTRVGCQADSYKQLLAEFPDAVRVQRAQSDDRIPYFSDYNVLEKWRARQDTNHLVDKVLSKSPYVACMRNDTAAPAKCVMRKAKESYRIVGYNVTHDEREEIRIPISFSNLKQTAQ